MILALDLGTSSGLCFGEGLSLPVVMARKMASTGDDVGEFLVDFRDWLVPIMVKVDPTLVIFEAPILPQPKVSIQWRGGKPVAVIEQMTNITTTRKLQGLAGMLEVICLDLGIEVKETHLGTMKKELTGNGHAEKGEMLRVARRVGIELSDGPDAFDEADAFAAWLVAIRYRGTPEARHYWDNRIHGRTGRA